MSVLGASVVPGAARSKTNRNSHVRALPRAPCNEYEREGMAGTGAMSDAPRRSFFLAERCAYVAKLALGINLTI